MLLDHSEIHDPRTNITEEGVGNHFEPANDADRAIPVTGRRSWSAIFGYLMESVFLYGAVYPTEIFHVDLSGMHPAQSEPSSGPGAVRAVPPEEVMRRLDASVSHVRFVDITPRSIDAAGLLSDRVTSVGLVRTSWDLVWELWAYWRLERNVKESVEALARLDDHTLRDIGINHRSGIEDVVRLGRHG
jgi:uncharacterized protein YjiS (DUF1127 family)